MRNPAGVAVRAACQASLCALGVYACLPDGLTSSLTLNRPSIRQVEQILFHEQVACMLCGELRVHASFLYFQLDLVLITSDVLQFRDQLPAP